MSEHAVGKWGRGEGLEVRSAQKRKGGNHLIAQKAWCYVCKSAHWYADGCRRRTGR